MAERNWVWDGFAWVEAIPPGTGISISSVIGLQEELDTLESSIASVNSDSPTFTGTADFVNIDASGTVTIPNGSLTVSKLSDIVTYLTTTWGELPTLWINLTTGVWPARTVPSGYTGAVRWDSTGYEDAVAPAAAAEPDRWRRVKPV